MRIELSQKVIGQRITALRKLKGLSQAELARKINMSRPSLAQIELGNRSVDVLELQHLSIILGFSLDEFMSEKFTAANLADIKTQDKKVLAKERVSVPELQMSKFKNVLLYILEKCAGKPNVGETVLINYYTSQILIITSLYEEHLTVLNTGNCPLALYPIS